MVQSKNLPDKRSNPPLDQSHLIKQLKKYNKTHTVLQQICLLLFDFFLPILLSKSNASSIKKAAAIFIKL